MAPGRWWRIGRWRATRAAHRLAGPRTGPADEVHATIALVARTRAARTRADADIRRPVQPDQARTGHFPAGIPAAADRPVGPVVAGPVLARATGADLAAPTVSSRVAVRQAGAPSRAAGQAREAQTSAADEVRTRAAMTVRVPATAVTATGPAVTTTGRHHGTVATAGPAPAGAVMTGRGPPRAAAATASQVREMAAPVGPAPARRRVMVAPARPRAQVAMVGLGQALLTAGMTARDPAGATEATRAGPASEMGATAVRAPARRTVDMIARGPGPGRVVTTPGQVREMPATVGPVRTLVGAATAGRAGVPPTVAMAARAPGLAMAATASRAPIRQQAVTGAPAPAPKVDVTAGQGQETTAPAAPVLTETLGRMVPAGPGVMTVTADLGPSPRAAAMTAALIGPMIGTGPARRPVVHTGGRAHPTATPDVRALAATGRGLTRAGRAATGRGLTRAARPIVAAAGLVRPALADRGQVAPVRDRQAARLCATLPEVATTGRVRAPAVGPRTVGAVRLATAVMSAVGRASQMRCASISRTA